MSYGCYSWRYHTYLSCICEEGYHTSGQGCWKCPDGLTSRRGSDQCDCPAGQQWAHGDCRTCPEDTFSLINSTSCTDCPGGSYASAGSENCKCTGGLYMSQNRTCAICPVNHYSYEGQTNCIACPADLQSSTYQSFCTCAAGKYWSFARHNCFQCPENYYSPSNSTSCTPCPENSISSNPMSGYCNCSAGYKWVSHRCEICPNNYFSKFGADKCTQCPHFKASGAGSEYCYRCTLGYSWLNETCQRCPLHLYGDGIHCNKCPPGFLVDQGFCYKQQSHSLIVYIASVLSSLLLMLCWKKRKKCLTFVSVLCYRCFGRDRDTVMRSKIKVKRVKIVHPPLPPPSLGTETFQHANGGGTVHFATKSSDNDDQRIYYVLYDKDGNPDIDSEV